MIKTYILSVIAVSLTAAAVSIFCPNGKGGGILKHLKLLTSLALICVIISPIVSLVKSLSDSSIDKFKDNIIGSISEGGDYESIFFKSLSDTSASELEKEIKKRICEAFQIDESNIEINAEYAVENDTVSFKRITVTLSGEAIFKSPYDIEDYVRTLTGIDCKCLL